MLDGLASPTSARLLPPIVDGTEAAGTARRRRPPQRPACWRARRSCSAMSTWSAPALGGGLYDRAGKVGCSIIGSTGMHMRLRAATPTRCSSTPDRSGYTMAFPVPGVYAQMQSNMAATLNIDWLLDLAREAAALAGRDDRADRSCSPAVDDRVAGGAQPAELLYHPYIFEAGERGPFLDPNARAQFSGTSTPARLRRPDARRLRGPGLRGARLLRGDGPMPGEVRLTGGAARARALRRSSPPRSAPKCARALARKRAQPALR